MKCQLYPNNIEHGISLFKTVKLGMKTKDII